MIPTQGRMVTIKGVSSNGMDEQAAVITRVWSEGIDTRDGAVVVNLTVFPDGSALEFHSSVLLFDNRFDATRTENPLVAFWPDRV